MRKPKMIVVGYYVGVDLLGQPQYVYHNVYLNTYNEKRRLKK